MEECLELDEQGDGDDEACSVQEVYDPAEDDRDSDPGQPEWLQDVDVFVAPLAHACDGLEPPSSASKASITASAAASPIAWTSSL